LLKFGKIVGLLDLARACLRDICGLTGRRQQKIETPRPGAGGISNQRAL
jgi:hypothetical protein